MVSICRDLWIFLDDPKNLRKSPNMAKTGKFSTFQVFFAFFVKRLIECWKRLKGKNSVFQETWQFLKKASNSDRIWKKFQKIQIFNVFLLFFSSLRKTWCLRKLKTYKKEKLRCPGEFCKEINALFYWKMAQVQTEYDENSKKYQFITILCHFCETFKSIQVSEPWKRSTLKEVVAQQGRSGR